MDLIAFSGLVLLSCELLVIPCSCCSCWHIIKCKQKKNTTWWKSHGVPYHYSSNTYRLPAFTSAPNYPCTLPYWPTCCAFFLPLDLSPAGQGSRRAGPSCRPVLSHWRGTPPRHHCPSFHQLPQLLGVATTAALGSTAAALKRNEKEFKSKDLKVFKILRNVISHIEGELVILQCRSYTWVLHWRRRRMNEWMTKKKSNKIKGLSRQIRLVWKDLGERADVNSLRVRQCVVTSLKHKTQNAL